MKLEVGMYVRTYDDGIDKLNFKYKRDGHNFYTFYFEKCSLTNPEYYIMGEPSFNIIDLIEVGDYVNGKEVAFIDEFTKEIAICETDLTTRDFEGRYAFKRIKEEDIKSIVTKEQFKIMEYKVGE